MGKSDLGSSQFWSFLDQDWPILAMAFLRRRYSTKTAECVAADLDMSENTVRKWLARQCVPNGIAILKMSIFYGPEFMASVVPGVCGWLSEAVIAERQKRLDARQAELDADKWSLGL